jgi:hypothetical protein
MFQVRTAIMAVSTNPTVVLIPGSFCLSVLSWNQTIDLLHESGFVAVAVELASVSKSLGFG